MGAETRSIKRKRSSLESAAPCPRKKAARAGAPGSAAPKATVPNTGAVTKKDLPTCPLVQTLREYGLLESITTCLFPGDLLSLALSCKATYNAMFPRPGSLENLLSKVHCSGNGVSIRRIMHRKSSFFYSQPCTEFAQCSTVSRRNNIESRPCTSCKVTTCDECRIHCVYQSIYEAPGHPEELPNFSGFVLLDPFEVAILSPQHLPPESDGLPEWRNPKTDSTVRPYHDQGFLDMALESVVAGTPEKISDVLDLDLGQVSLTTWSASSQFGSPSPVLRVFCNVAEQRRLLLCEACFTDVPKGYKAIKPAMPKLPWLSDTIDQSAEDWKECHCSLRSRILDRWQCVKCYQAEDAILRSLAWRRSSNLTKMCRCGLSAKKSVCLWCWGEIVETREVNEEAHTEIPTA